MVNDLGTDISSTWTFNENGDLNTVENTDNLNQAISNRLKTDIGTVLFYNEYGTMLASFLGWLPTANNLEFIRLEIGNRLMQDPRLKAYDVKVKYTGDGGLTIDINATLNDGENYSESFVIDDSGVEII